MKKMLTRDAFETVLELPDRELLGTLISIRTGPLHVGPINNNDVTVLSDIANHSFNNWRISVLNDNELDLDVEDNLSDNTVAVFCNQVVAVLALQCAAVKKY
jgi:hypothetical protein